MKSSRRKSPKAIGKVPAPADLPYNRMVGYARVSTAEQRLDLQIDALKAAGVMDDNLHVEKLSATSRRRRELEMAMKDLREGDTFVVWRLDRLARNMRELYERLDQVKEAGASFKSLTEHFDFSSATGQLVLGFLGLMAQFERQLTIERTKAGMQALRDRGHTLGRRVEFTPAKQAKAKKMVEGGKKVVPTCKEIGISPATFYGYFQVKHLKNGAVRVIPRKST